MPYVYSTATAGNIYKFWRKGGGDLPVADGEVFVAGGANVTNKHLQTPLGIATKVTREEAEKLKQHPTFKKHMERGFMTIRDDNDKVDVEVAAADMEGRDGSAPLTDNDFAEGKEPGVGSKSDDADDKPKGKSKGGKKADSPAANTPPPPPKAV